jgi:hemoglobin
MKERGGYGQKAFDLLGGVEGVKDLANCFYDVMEQLPDAQIIRDMHPADLGATREHFALFLCGWLGGPPLYNEKFGSANLAGIHVHFDIGIAERDMWLACMDAALKKQPIGAELQAYLIERFRIPAEKIRITCNQQVKGLPVVLPSGGLVKPTP